MGKFNTIAAWILLTAYAATVLMSFMAPGQQEALSQVQFLLAPLFALFGSSARYSASSPRPTRSRYPPPRRCWW